jgi:hypothetical protein
MALPKIKHPTYSVTIPSTQQSINIKPFTVQEEKILLMAKSSEKTEDVIAAVKQIIQNCIIEAIDVDKLATFDIEYLFVKLRSKSIGEVVDLEYKDPDTEEVIKFKVNLDDIEIKRNPDHKNKFTINEDVGLSMRYPTLDEIRVIEESDNQENGILDMLFKCVDKIYDNETVYTDFSETELQEFINSLPMDSMNKIKEFFDTMPTLEHTVKLKNKNGKTSEVVLKGLNSFFM